MRYDMHTQSILFFCLCALLLSSCATKLQKQVDAELSQLCAQDGGIKVYETVTLPPEMPLYVKISELVSRSTYKSPGSSGSYRELAPEIRTIVNPDLFDPSFNTNALGPDYIWEKYTRVLPDKQSDENDAYRIHYRLIRRADKKLLGEIVTYLRFSFSFWSQTQYSCPIEGNYVDLLRGVHLIPAVFQDNPQNLEKNKPKK